MKNNKMANDKNLFDMQGKIIDVLPNQQFKVQLDNKQVTLCYTSGRMRKHKVKLVLGDNVRVELSPYDLTRGRICFRM